MRLGDKLSSKSVRMFSTSKDTSTKSSTLDLNEIIQENNKSIKIGQFSTVILLY